METRTRTPSEDEFTIPDMLYWLSFLVDAENQYTGGVDLTDRRETLRVHLGVTTATAEAIHDIVTTNYSHIERLANDFTGATGNWGGRVCPKIETFTTLFDSWRSSFAAPASPSDSSTSHDK